MRPSKPTAIEKIETIVVQHPWLENDTIYADIILPANTMMEVDDIVTHTRQGVQFQHIAIQNKAIEPIGESKSDFECVMEVAKKMGKYEEITQGQTLPDLQKLVFTNMGCDNLPEPGKNSKINSISSSPSPKIGRKMSKISLEKILRGSGEQSGSHSHRQNGDLLTGSGRCLPHRYGKTSLSAVG